MILQAGLSLVYNGRQPVILHLLKYDYDAASSGIGPIFLICQGASTAFVESCNRRIWTPKLALPCAQQKDNIAARAALWLEAGIYPHLYISAKKQGQGCRSVRKYLLHLHRETTFCRESVDAFWRMIWNSIRRIGVRSCGLVRREHPFSLSLVE